MHLIAYREYLVVGFVQNRTGEKNMAAYMIFTREKTRDGEQLAAYSKRAGGTLAGHKVKPLVAYGNYEVMEGAAIEGAVVLEFPTMEEAKAWYNSAAYVEAREIRFKGADYRCVLVQGVS